MLMDHSNASLDGIRGRIDHNTFAIDKDFTFIRLIQSIENIHQGRFSSAVFA